MVTTITGDALNELAKLADQSVHCIVTSPPYFGLRDYGIEGQIGLEEAPEEYVGRLVEVFREARRVLRDDGTLWLNIGDSYAGSGKGAAHYPDNAMLYKQGTSRGLMGEFSLRSIVPDGCKPKDLIGIPWMLAFALRADGWYLRQDIVWYKPNCMPESVTDRCTKSHEYIFLMSKSKNYYFDADSISEAAVGFNNEPVAGSNGTFGNEQTRRRKGNNRSFRGGGAYTGGQAFQNSADAHGETRGNAANSTGLRKKRDVWTVATNGGGTDIKHYATYPISLVEPCIIAGCPMGGTVLDPFFGSGTTGEAASALGRNCIGIELNPEYARAARRRNSQMTLYDVLDSTQKEGRNSEA